ncbi:hypothetical protein ACFQEX_17535 [Roseibium salinum]
MGNLIEAGEWLEARPGDDVIVFDLVSVLLTGFTGPWAQFVNALSDEGMAGLVKIALGQYAVEGETVFLFGQLNPPTVVPIPASVITSIDKIDFFDKPEGAELEALKLLIPFAGTGLHERKAA